MSNPTSFLKRGLKSALSIFFTQTKVIKIDRIAKDFCVLEMVGVKLKESKLAPGGKIQIDIGNLTFRTYTPISIDKNNGKLTLLCHRREGSPATAWIDALKIGDSCDIFGPRESLDFSNVDGEVALFGDETSFGASKALQNTAKKKAYVFFELTSGQESLNVLRRIGVEDPRTIPRCSDGLHLQKIAKDMIELHSRSGFSMIFLTGRASSIQLIRQLLKDSGFPSAKLKTRAYWADGKIGLD